MADNNTVQKLATEAFLRKCQRKEAKSLTLNQNPMLIQVACRSVKTILANKKAIFVIRLHFRRGTYSSRRRESVKY